MFAKRVASLMKRARLEADPMLDRVAVALNSGTTYEEVQEAERWLTAIKSCGGVIALPDKDISK